MKRGSTLNFKKESAAFAKTLQAEHEALGDLLEELEDTALVGDIADARTRAKAAHDAVQFQRSRTEASVGRR